MTLSRQLSAVTGWALPPWSAGPVRSGDLFASAASAGYEGVQVFLPEQLDSAVAAGLARSSGIGTARTIDEVDAVMQMWSGTAATTVTLHLGTGFETSAQGHALVEATLRSAAARQVDVLIETHRATLFQDPARALSLVEEFPELRFTADLSHWYTGVELVYGDLDAKLEALGPVFQRCRMIHGRISDPGCIQVAVQADDPADHVEHFRRMWAAVIAGAATSGELDVLPFVVELLPAIVHYARTVDRGDGPEEEVDRWSQADLLWEIVTSLEPAR